MKSDKNDTTSQLEALTSTKEQLPTSGKAAMLHQLQAAFATASKLLGTDQVSIPSQSKVGNCLGCLRNMQILMDEIGFNAEERALESIIKQIELMNTHELWGVVDARLALSSLLAASEIMASQSLGKNKSNNNEKRKHRKSKVFESSKKQNKEATLRLKEELSESKVAQARTGSHIANAAESSRLESPSQKLLLVQSDDDVMHSIAVSLENLGEPLHLTKAFSLTDAMSKLEKSSFDLILLDLFLSDSSGLDTLAAMKEICGGKPILVLTGLESSSLADLAVSAGAQDYLVYRLLPPRALLRCINHAIARNAMERRESRLRAIEDFLNALAHDIRMPIQAMDRVTQHLIHSDEKLSPELAQSLKVLKRSNTEVLRRLEKLMELYQMESGAIVPRLGRHDIVPIILERLGNFAEAHPESEFDLRIDENVKSLRLRTDKQLLEKVVDELMENAYKHGDRRTKIRIVLGIDHERFKFAISNRGKMIDAADMGLLFKNFWTGAPGVAYVSTVGMGLYYCNQILKCLDGNISCKSNIEWTTFSLDLPLRQSGPELESVEVTTAK